MVGISALFVPLLAGLVAAAVQYVLAPANPRGTLPRRFGFVLFALVVFTSYMALRGVSLLPDESRWILFALGLAGAGAVWMVAARTSGFVSLALIFFAYGALYGACFKLVRELSITPRFDLAVAFRGVDRRPISGLYLARTADDVLVARLAPDLAKQRDDEWQTIVVPADQVTTLVFGPHGAPVDRAAQQRANKLKRLLVTRHADLNRKSGGNAKTDQQSGAKDKAGGDGAQPNPPRAP